ncbi:MAG: hypothetical protein Q9220_002617 [cf. Caloplaca sp. 1 TL-2023]
MAVALRPSNVVRPARLAWSFVEDVMYPRSSQVINYPTAKAAVETAFLSFQSCLVPYERCKTYPATRTTGHRRDWSIIIDYIPEKRLPRTFKLFWWGLRAATLAVAIGFFEFETNDVGVTEAVKKIWTAKHKEETYVEPILRGVM